MKWLILAAESDVILKKLDIIEVENFIDICLSLENLIDQHGPHIEQKIAKKEKR